MTYTDEEKNALKIVAKLADRICDKYDVCTKCPWGTALVCRLITIDHLCEDAGVN